MSYRRKSDPVQAHQVLFGQQNFLGRQLKLLKQIQDKWPHIVGEGLTNQTQPIQIKYKTLYIGVYDTIWIQELSFYNQKILAKIEELLPLLQIDQIQYQLIAQEVVVDQPKQQEIPSSKKMPHIDPEKIKKLQDPNLRAAFEQFLKDSE